MKKRNETLIPVCVYCDSTGLFSETECERENLTDMYFPVWILEEWYKKNEKEYIESCEAMDYPPCLENWYTEVYTADETDGLYDFAIEHGYDPTFFAQIDNIKNAVVYDDYEGNTVVVFKGTNLECRKWAREHDWKYEYWYTSLETLEEESEEVDLEMLFS